MTRMCSRCGAMPAEVTHVCPPPGQSTATFPPPAHPVEPEPTLVDGKPICPHCGWGGDHVLVAESGDRFYCEDCAVSFTADEAARAQVAQAVESGERHGFWTQAQRERVARQVMSHSEAENVVRYVDGLREALRLQRERGQRIERVAEKATDWRFSDEFIGQIFRAALSDSGPSKESREP